MKKDLVILGTGFGAFSCLKNINTKQYNIQVVSPRNHFLFTPLLPGTTVGTIEFRSIIEPVRNIQGIQYFQAVCKEIDSMNNKVYCEDSDSGKTFELGFDILVIAVGEITNTYGIEGVRNHAYFLREVTDARKIRIKVIDCFENASLPDVPDAEKRNLLRFVVCGGGPTGVEFAAELHDFIEEDVNKKYPGLRNYIEVLLIEAGEKLLSSFDQKLSEYTLKLFNRQKINVKTKSYITKVTRDEIFTSEGNSFGYGILVWAAGNTATELLKNTILPKNGQNKILVDEHFAVKGTNNIYCLGDCCDIENHQYPATAQVAQREGKYLAKALNKLAKGNSYKPFTYKDIGMLAYIGSHKALANLSQYKGSGFAIWLFWRSVYVTKLVSLKNKVLVLFDWFKNFLFGRDVSNF